MDKITFTVFADLHYKKGMYVASVKDLQEIFNDAESKGSELVLHLGDMCNDYLHSPELVNTYLSNSKDVIGIYGNHELETEGNDMSFVTPLLTNRAENVVWGTDDGNIGDGGIGYYYYDKGNFRFVCTDTNYSLDPATLRYEHNSPASWGPPAENLHSNSVGPIQLEWLDRVLTDAAELGKTCIVASHASFYEDWDTDTDAEKVRALFDKANSIRKNTVVLALNGHYHNNRSAVYNDVVYLDINTVRNGWWQFDKLYPYAEAD